MRQVVDLSSYLHVHTLGTPAARKELADAHDAITEQEQTCCMSSTNPVFGSTLKKVEDQICHVAEYQCALFLPMMTMTRKQIDSMFLGLSNMIFNSNISYDAIMYV
jgi:hypothetical protein